MTEENVTKATPVKKPAPKKTVSQSGLIDWETAIKEVETAIKDAKWDKAKQYRRPTFLFGIVSKSILRRLVQAINEGS